MSRKFISWLPTPPTKKNQPVLTGLSFEPEIYFLAPDKTNQKNQPVLTGLSFDPEIYLLAQNYQQTIKIFGNKYNQQIA